MTRPYRIGDAVLLRATDRHPLPKGVRAGQEATVVWFLPGRRLVEAGGRYFEVAMSNVRPPLDTGCGGT